MNAVASNIIPFPRQPRAPEAESLSFAIGARVDLRIGALASGVVRPRGSLAEAYSFSGLSRLLRGARMAWRERGVHAPITLMLPSELHAQLDPDLLNEAAIEAGCTSHSLSFEMCERALIATSAELAEEMRARGWGIVLRADPDCPLPLSKRARLLYSELVLDAPDTPSPFLGLAREDRSLLSQRIAAATEAGILITAESIKNAAQAKMLAIAGFDRGGGPFAEAGLR
jgi:hypothetical protein